MRAQVVDAPGGVERVRSPGTSVPAARQGPSTGPGEAGRAAGTPGAEGAHARSLARFRRRHDAGRRPGIRPVLSRVETPGPARPGGPADAARSGHARSPTGRAARHAGEPLARAP